MANLMALWRLIFAAKLGKPRPPANLFWLSALTILLSGCVSLYDPESSHEWHSTHIHTLRSNELASQTLVLKQAALNKITIWASPVENPPADATITLSFIDLNHKPKYLFALSQPLTICQNGQCVFTIPTKHRLQPGTYSILIESTAPIHLWGNLLDSYPQGKFSINNQDTSGDLGFSLEYRYTFQSLLEDIRRFKQDFWITLPTLVFLFTPGILILRVLRFPLPNDLSIILSIVISTSLAFPPIVLAWTSSLNFSWNETIVRVTFYSISLVAVYLAMRNRRIWVPKFCIEDMLLFLIFILALLIRLIMSRNLVAPAWIDSVHHALITQLILQKGAYPDTYQPFLNTATTAYHSGFHANLAFFTWLSALPLPTAMLVLGQILNALSIYSAYTFTLAFYPKRFAGMIAALLVAFFSPMPAYYTSWGRYTQLCGLLLLPTLIYLIRRRLSAFPSRSISFLSTSILLALLFSGLIVIHYRVSYFLALLFGLSILEKIFQSPTQSRIRRIFRLCFNLIVIGILTLIFTATWLPQAWTTLILPKLNTWNQPPSAPESIPWGLLTAALGDIVLILAGLGLCIEILRRSWKGITLFLWILLCYATIYLSYWTAKGVGFLNMTSVTISLYLPLSALGGQGISKISQWLTRYFPKKHRWLHPILLLCTILITALIGARALIPLLNPITMLVRADDLRAMVFLKNETQPNQKVLIQPFLWGYGLYAGSDGGSWIPALAQRSTIPPPVLFALDESSDHVRQINQISQKVLDKPNNASWIASLMQENSLDYLYLGGKGGAISPYIISQSPNFELIYHQGRVFIFKLKSQQNPP
ncbi:MAG: hypothetical protein N3D16_00745 [Anaerolineales bacterium]|nr:hypothetical protein [Anaerolineales bacterium]